MGSLLLCSSTRGTSDQAPACPIACSNDSVPDSVAENTSLGCLLVCQASQPASACCSWSLLSLQQEPQLFVWGSEMQTSSLGRAWEGCDNSLTRWPLPLLDCDLVREGYAQRSHSTDGSCILGGCTGRMLSAACTARCTSGARAEQQAEHTQACGPALQKQEWGTSKDQPGETTNKQSTRYKPASWREQGLALGHLTLQP